MIEKFEIKVWGILFWKRIFLKREASPDSTFNDWYFRKQKEDEWDRCGWWDACNKEFTSTFFTSIFYSPHLWRSQRRRIIAFIETYEAIHNE